MTRKRNKCPKCDAQLIRNLATNEVYCSECGYILESARAKFDYGPENLYPEQREKGVLPRGNKTRGGALGGAPVASRGTLEQLGIPEMHGYLRKVERKEDYAAYVKMLVIYLKPILLSLLPPPDKRVYGAKKKFVHSVLADKKTRVLIEKVLDAIKDREKMRLDRSEQNLANIITITITELGWRKKKQGGKSGLELIREAWQEVSESLPEEQVAATHRFSIIGDRGPNRSVEKEVAEVDRILECIRKAIIEGYDKGQVQFVKDNDIKFHEIEGCRKALRGESKDEWISEEVLDKMREIHYKFRLLNENAEIEKLRKNIDKAIEQGADLEKRKFLQEIGFDAQKMTILHRVLQGKEPYKKARFFILWRVNQECPKEAAFLMNTAKSAYYKYVLLRDYLLLGKIEKALDNAIEVGEKTTAKEFLEKTGLKRLQFQDLKRLLANKKPHDHYVNSFKVLQKEPHECAAILKKSREIYFKHLLLHEYTKLLSIEKKLQKAKKEGLGQGEFIRQAQFYTSFFTDLRIFLSWNEPQRDFRTTWKLEEKGVCPAAFINAIKKTGEEVLMLYSGLRGRIEFAKAPISEEATLKTEEIISEDYSEKVESELERTIEAIEHTKRSELKRIREQARGLMEKYRKWCPYCRNLSLVITDEGLSCSRCKKQIIE